MNIGDLVLVYNCPSTTAATLGIVAGIDFEANDFSGDLDADMYRVFITEQGLIRWFTSRHLILLSKRTGGKK